MSTPWSDGFYYSTESPFINQVKGNKVYLRNLVELEFPEIEVDQSMKGSWTFGKFHETSKEIQDKTGANHYDVEIIGKVHTPLLCRTHSRSTAPVTLPLPLPLPSFYAAPTPVLPLL